MAKVKLKITKTDGTIYEVDRFNGLKNVQSTSQSTPDAESIVYGALPNTGTADIIDINGDIETMIKNGEIKNSNVPVDIYIDNTLAQKHLTENSDYTPDKILKLNLLNDISQYSNLKCFFPQSNIQNSMTLRSIVTQCFYYAGFSSNDYYLLNTIFTEEGDPISVYDYLGRFTISNPYFLDSSFGHIIQTICETAQLLCCKNNEGKIIFVNANPRINTSLESTTPNVVHIPKYLQITQPETSLFVREKITNVAHQKRKIQKSIAQVLDEYFVLRDSNNQVSADQLGDNAQIITEGNSTYACFFIKFNSDENNLNYFYIPDNTIDEYSFEWYNSNGDLIGGGGGSYIMETSNSTISDFNFSTEMAYTSFKRLVKYDTFTSAVFAVKVSVDANDYKVRVMVKSQNYKIIDGELEKYNSDENYYTLPQNELINLGTTYRVAYNLSISIYDFLVNNIISFYANGIKTAKLTIFADNLYSYSQGNTAIRRVDYDNGEIISLDQNLIIDKDNNKNSAFKYQNGKDVIWRVVGKTFRYDGAKQIDLELQEAKDLSYVVTFPQSVQVLKGVGTTEPISSGDEVGYGEVLTINFKSSFGSLNYIKVNGTEIQDGDSTTVTSNIQISVSYVKTLQFKTLTFNLNSSGTDTTFYFEPQDGEEYLDSDTLVYNNSLINSTASGYPKLSSMLDLITSLGTAFTLNKVYNTIPPSWDSTGTVTLYHDRVEIYCSDSYFRGASVIMQIYDSGTSSFSDLYYTRTIVE